MKEINIDIENGYGILEFKHNFTFENSSNFYALYAQNGTMKSSFAKVLDDYSRGLPIKDHLFNHPGTCSLAGIAREDILSFPCFDGKVELTDEASKLVTNTEAKKTYDEAFREVSAAYKAFANKLLETTRSTSIEASQLVEAMYRTFVTEGNAPSITIPSVIQLLRSGLPEIEKGNTLFSDVSYSRFVHTNFAKFIENKKYAGFFTDLAKAYDEFRASPTYYRKGFDASSATKLIGELKKSKYFDAEHAVALKGINGQITEPIRSASELESALKTDFDAIIEQYPHLEAPLNTLIKDFATGTNGDVRSIFEDGTKRDLLVFMGSKDRFYKNMWYGYLASCMDEVKTLLDIHEKSSEKIMQALGNAEDCTSEWEETVDIFNDRFRNLPYTIGITNKSDAIVNDLVKPVFEIKFANPRNPGDPYRERPDGSNELPVLGTVLSNGERKALYLLNVIFRLRNQIKENRETLVVFDDIVESFDYKNKYAFFEYLQDLSIEDSKLYVIVLTHNFDFYRLVYEKIYPRHDNQFKLILKTKDGKLTAQDMFDPKIFSDIKKKAAIDKQAWIALLPLARNIAEYKNGAEHEDYNQLTRCLHVMRGHPTVGEVKDTIEAYTGVTRYPFNAGEKIHDIITDVANAIDQETDDSFSLYKNFALAMATRIQIEKYIIAHISDSQYENILTKARNQTRELLKVYNNNSPDPKKATMRTLFNRAIMMIDGSIHINSFMYEPLIDMGTWELKEAYADIKKAANE